LAAVSELALVEQLELRLASESFCPSKRRRPSSRLPRFERQASLLPSWFLQPDGISQQSFLQDGASRQIVPTIWLRRLWWLWVWKVTSL
jgi:hypothetical protein